MNNMRTYPDNGYVNKDILRYFDKYICIEKIYLEFLSAEKETLL